MNNVYGMSLSQFNKTIEEMRSIYPFRDDNTVLGDLHDVLTNCQRRVEIMTIDKDTGVTIIMSKAVDEYREEMAFYSEDNSRDIRS